MDKTLGTEDLTKGSRCFTPLHTMALQQRCPRPDRGATGTQSSTWQSLRWGQGGERSCPPTVTHMEARGAQAVPADTSCSGHYLVTQGFLSHDKQ